MKLPPPLQAALTALRSAGGRPRLVGGSVRDWLLGLEAKDFDIEVYGMDYEAMGRALAAFGPTDVVGRSFGVVKVRIAGAEYDFSLPRRESKTGAGHRGFVVAPDSTLTEAEAAARRDFTVNAIAYDPLEDRILDFHHGVADLKKKILRHTSPAFTEDPLRVLRAFQFAARFEFTLAPETAVLCHSIRDTNAELPVERVWGEWEKWAVKSAKPSLGLTILKQTGWLQHYPEIAALDGLPQEPEWHPEGDVFVHTGHCLDALVRLDSWRKGTPATRRMLSLAVLAHDFGKAGTTKQAERRGRLRWTSPEHEAAGGPLAETFLPRIGAPLDLITFVRPLVVNHLLHHDGPAEYRDTTVRRLARKVAPATLDDLMAVMWSDHLGRPPLVSAETEKRLGFLRQAAQKLALEHAAPKPIVLGRHLIALGRKPGPDFGPALDAAFESQLDGAFADEPGGLEWLKNYLRAHPSL
ncbi:Multifunctional CCA protein [Lacunisphaera limnophila]|uniref:Multifunctional CCA protein n=1 Tax=Lacunisphaera limnophila TaxID=1838286 RepID=A0A1D8ASD4_9BACT|nr:polynucleotide adenylyltransferase [Lacunisphaera limnophila]AOS43798.1 Multifunctional CCA protein [Lacunisphaera limnophila]